MRLAVQRLLLAAGALFFGAPAAVAGAAGSIGVYADALGRQAHATFSIGVPRSLFVVAHIASGVTGAEFRIDGFPDDWYVGASPNPAAAVWLGDPVHTVGGVRRANIAFQYCTPGSDGALLFCSLIVIPTSSTTPRPITIEAGDPPTRPDITTPIFTLCDVPDYTLVEAIGDTFHLETRAPHDLDYSSLPGYDYVRGVVPEAAVAGEARHFRVVYTSADGQLPSPGSPRVELDVDGDGDALDPGEGSFTMSPGDLDSTLVNGKEYRFDVALGEPARGMYRYRFVAVDAAGESVPGAATAWLPLTFASGRPDLTVKAEEIRVFPPNPDPNQPTTLIARIENLADTPAADVLVRIENEFGSPIATRTLAAVGARSATELAFTWRFVNDGYQPIVVRVDPGGAIPQSDITNDAASHGVFVGGFVLGSGLAIHGLPPLITVPPSALFGFDGTVAYVPGSTPIQLVRGAPVTVVPSWGAPQYSRTNASGGFSAGFVSPSVPGSYRLTVRVTDGSRTDSTTADVHVETLPGSEPRHLPDLAMRLSAELDAGATEAVLSWSVLNHGDRPSPATTARLLAEDLSHLAEVPVGALAPGAEQSLGLLHVPLAGPGLRSFTAHADPQNGCRELREDDNAAVARLRVPPACVDLAFDGLRFAAAPVCAGTPTRGTVHVSNRGMAASQAARVACRSGASELASVGLPALQRDESADLTFELALGAGCSDLRFLLDPEGAAGSDCDAASNVLWSAACLEECGPPPPIRYPDFRVQECDIAVSDSHPAAGTPVVFRAWISNVGIGDALQAAHVQFAIDSFNLGGAVLTAPIPAGGRVLVQASTVWPVDFAPHVLRVVIDPRGQERPGDGADDSASRALPWNLRVVPLTRCPPASPAMFSSCAPCPLDSVRIRARVVNTGMFDCDPVRVEFRDEFRHVVLGSVDVHGVPGGGSCSAPPPPIGITTTFPAASTYRVAVVVDPDDVWYESDETDNRYEQDLQVGCAMLPDLTASARLTANPTPQPGDTVRAIEVTVRNLGTGSALGVQAGLRLDGMVLCSMNVGNLVAHSSSTVVCTTPWVVRSLGCTQRIEVCADPDRRILESDETNNCSVSGVGGPAETDLGLVAAAIAVKPPNPSLGDLVEIKVGMYSNFAIESSCVLKVRYGVGGVLSDLANVPLQFPAGQTFFPEAATFVWNVSLAPPLDLVFELTDICPADIEASNNVVHGTLPWFRVPETPVTVSDMAAESTPDGVRVHWRAEEVAVFALERRRAGELEWTRLADDIAPAAGSSHSFEYLDRDAEAGAQLEYQLLWRAEDGHERPLGTLSVRHDAARVLVQQLRPVRPQPFRPGGTFEFTLPGTRSVDLALFDAAGRRIASLLQGPASAGLHVLSWDGRDETGRRMPAGVYFCRLATGAFRQTQRIVLLP